MRSSLLLAAAMACAGPVNAQVALELRPGETLLEVQAVGQTSVAPDIAYLEIGVVTTATGAKEATDANAEKMTGVIAAIRAAGIEPRFIRSEQINVQPRFARAGQNDFQGQAQITGYVARNSVNVTVTKLDLASAVVTAAFGAGANSVNGPNLGLLDSSKAVAEARKDALADARAEAETYAAGLGMRVARVLRVSERGRSTDGVANANLLHRLESPAASYAATPVARGEMRQRVTLWIDFALAPK